MPPCGVRPEVALFSPDVSLGVRTDGRVEVCAKSVPTLVEPRTFEQCVLKVEEIQRKSRVREWAPQKAPRIRAGVTKKDQKAELKKNQTRRCYAEKTSIFSDDPQTPARREARNHRSEDAKMLGPPPCGPQRTGRAD